MGGSVLSVSKAFQILTGHGGNHMFSSPLNERAHFNALLAFSLGFFNRFAFC